MPKLPSKDPLVLQHDISGTIHELRKDGRTLCGRTKSENYKKRRLSVAQKRLNAHWCGSEKAKSA